VVGTDAENRDPVVLADLCDVIDIAIQHYPADAGGHCRPGYLRQSGSTHRFEDDSIRVRFGSRLNDAQNLLTLGDRIVFGVDNLDVRARRRAVPRRRGLLDLISLSLVVSETGI